LFLSRMVFPVIWVLEITQIVSYFSALLMFSVMAIISKIGLCFWVLACIHGSTFLEGDDIPVVEEDENALSVILSSKTNSKQSSPRSDKKTNAS